MVLDVIPVVEENEIVEAAVVARCSTGMLEIPVKIAEHEAQSDARQIDRHEKPGRSP
jgi:hypothetical protein